MRRNYTLLSQLTCISVLGLSVLPIKSASADDGDLDIVFELIGEIGDGIDYLLEEEAAGGAKVTANDVQDTDSDRIRRITRWFGETDIDLDAHATNQKAEGRIHVDYDVKQNIHVSPPESIIRTGRPDDGEKNPQTATAWASVAAGGKVVFRLGNGGRGLPSPPDGVIYTDFATMDDVFGTVQLDVQLEELERRSGQAHVALSYWDSEAENLRLQAGVLDDALAGDEYVSDDLALPAEYEELLDVGVTRIAEDVWVPLTDSQGIPYTDEELFARAAEQLISFDVGRDDGTFSLAIDVGPIADSKTSLSMLGDFSVPAGLPSWIAEGRSLLSPDWTHYDPLLDSGAMTYEEVWDEVIAAVEATGDTVQIGALFEAHLQSYASSQATPEPSTLSLLALGGAMLTRRRR